MANTLLTPVVYPEMHLGNPTAREVNRDRQADKIIRIASITGFSELMPSDASIEERLGNFNSRSDDEWLETLNALGGFLLNTPRSNWGYPETLQYIGGPDFTKFEDIMPAEKDKESLLRLLLGTGRGCEDPKTAPLLLAFGINAIHPMYDGNGRISRLLYHTLTRGFDAEDPMLHKLLGDDGDTTYDLNASLFLLPTFHILKKALGTHRAFRKSPDSLEELVPKTKKAIKVKRDVILIEEVTGRETTYEELRILTALFNDSNISEMLTHMLAREKLDAKATTRKMHGQQQFLVDEFMKKGSDRDIDLLFEAAFKIKKKYVEILIAELAKPVKDQEILGYNTRERGQLALRYSQAGSALAERTLTYI